MQIAESFIPLLSEFDLAALEADSGVIYAVCKDLRLSYVNSAWFGFAAENGEPEISRNWPLGRSIMDAVAEPLRPFFASHFRRALEQMRPWEHMYECSTPDQLRRFRMKVFPLGAGAGEGLLVTHSLIVEVSVDRPAAEPVEDRFRDADGIIHQCAHCRRVREQPPYAGWVWVPGWVERCPSRTSHGICTPCFGFYYSDQVMEQNELPRPFHSDPPY